MSYKIESGIPKPSSKMMAESFKYPFADMAVGDSFCFHTESGPVGSAEIQKVRSACSWYGKRSNRKYSVMRISQTESRCWRTA